VIVVGHVFVDETKDRGYVVAAAVVMSEAVVAARQTMRGLILPRQRRIHFHKESDARRHKILTAIAGLDVEVIIYDATSYANAKNARDACLVQLIADLAELKAERVVPELDDSNVRSDQRILYRQVVAEGRRGTLTYHHMRAHEEILLTIPDAIAWCWARGGHWRTRIGLSVIEVRRV
jgi:hypothetical protein